MLSKTITYKDLFDEAEHTDVFYFNLTETEVLELKYNGFNTRLVAFMESAKTKALNADAYVTEMLSILKEIVVRSYGVRKGSAFIKNSDVAEEFLGSPAYNALMMELVKDETKFNDFVKAVFPKTIVAKIDDNAVKLQIAEIVDTTTNP